MHTNGAAKTILIINDIVAERESLLGMLHRAGYQTEYAASAADAVASINHAVPDLMVLDIAIAGMDGIAFLEQLRKSEQLIDLPVIILTQRNDRHDILRASKLNIRDYLLKSSCWTDQLLARVQKHLTGPARAVEQKARPAENRDAVARNPSSAERPENSSIVRLTREKSIRRAIKTAPTRTWGGVIGQVIEATLSPLTDVTKLAALIGQDMSLAARILQVANSPAYITAHGPVTTISDAVRNIGSSVVCNIAVSLGVLDVMPTTSADGFNAFHCWRHSLAVAHLCEHLCRQKNELSVGAAYLMGLCHDLGELLFREQFGVEYGRVLELEKQTGGSRAKFENEILGMPRAELVRIIFEQLSLPPAIRGPIEQFHGAGKSASRSTMTRILQLADMFADSLMLATRPTAPIAPFTREQCRIAIGIENPVMADLQTFRCRMVSLTCMLAKLTQSEGEQLAIPFYPKLDVRIWLARDPALSEFDPLHVLLDSLAEVTVESRMPSSDEAARIDGLVIAARSTRIKGFGESELARINRDRNTAIRCLWMVGEVEPVVTPAKPGGGPVVWPVPMNEVAKFVQGVKTAVDATGVNTPSEGSPSIEQADLETPAAA